MSFGMDDLSRSYGVDPALQTRLIEETRTAEKAVKVKAADSRKKESDVDDVFESDPAKAAQQEKSFKDIQEKSTSIDIVNESLDKIASYIEEVKSTIKEENPASTFNQKIKENYEKIDKVVRETSFNDQQLIEEKKNRNNKAIASAEELKISEVKKLQANTPAQVEETAKKLDEMLDSIKRKQEDLAKNKEKAVEQITRNSLVEIKPNAEVKEIEIKEPEQVSVKEVKEKAIEGIKENPEKSYRMQIRHLDRNLLLAMISLRGV